MCKEIVTFYSIKIDLNIRNITLKLFQDLAGSPNKSAYYTWKTDGGNSGSPSVHSYSPAGGNHGGGMVYSSGGGMYSGGGGGGMYSGGGAVSPSHGHSYAQQVIIFFMFKKLLIVINLIMWIKINL